MPSRPSDGNRAAASSMARALPSSRRQISPIGVGSDEEGARPDRPLEEQRRRRPRRPRSAARGRAPRTRSNGSIGQGWAWPAPTPVRHCPSSPLDEQPTPATRCSQLGRGRAGLAVARWSRTRSSLDRPGESASPERATRRGGTSASSVTGTRATKPDAVAPPVGHSARHRRGQASRPPRRDRGGDQARAPRSARAAGVGDLGSTGKRTTGADARAGRRRLAIGRSIRRRRRASVRARRRRVRAERLAPAGSARRGDPPGMSSLWSRTTRGSRARTETRTGGSDLGVRRPEPLRAGHLGLNALGDAGVDDTAYRHRVQSAWWHPVGPGVAFRWRGSPWWFRGAGLVRPWWPLMRNPGQAHRARHGSTRRVTDDRRSRRPSTGRAAPSLAVATTPPATRPRSRAQVRRRNSRGSGRRLERKGHISQTRRRGAAPALRDRAGDSRRRDAARAGRSSRGPPPPSW